MLVRYQTALQPEPEIQLNGERISQVAGTTDVKGIGKFGGAVSLRGWTMD